MEVNVNDIVIVIPIYNERPDNIELFSLQTLLSNLENDYTICLVHPKLFDISVYKQYMFKWKGKLIEREFDNSYFTSTTAYSKLCKSHEFYLSFINYKYMLIYQTDCILNFDSILDFAEAGYDYIGAPILGTGSGWKNIPYVGNGGLSLRKIATFCYITDPNGEFLRDYKEDIESEVPAIEDGYNRFEDLYFAECIPNVWTEFSKPNHKIASLFAWDRNMELCWALNEQHIPMGFHAWDKSIDYV